MLAIGKSSPEWTGETSSSWPQLEHKGLTCTKEENEAGVQHSLLLGFILAFDLFCQVPLLLHQKQALAWLLWRESQKPQGGILGKFGIA